MVLNERKAKTLVALLFVLLTFIGLCTVNDYTGSYDEIAEQSILSSNMKEYALLLEKCHIIWEPWLQKNVVPISQSIEKDHGISGYYLYGLIFPKIENQETLRYSLWGIVTWLWFMMGVWSLYALARYMNLSRALAFSASLLLYLSPRFFAEGHFNNKDIVLLAQMLVTLWQGTRWIQKSNINRGLLFSLAGAMAMNTKIVAVIAWVFVFGSVLLKVTLKKEWTMQSIGSICTTAFAFAAFYVLLTPAMWKNPTEFFSYLFNNAKAFSRWEGRLFFRGASFQLPENQLPVYYLVYLMIVTLPLYTFPLYAIGQFETIRKAIDNPKKFFTQPNGLVLMCATCCSVVSIGAFVLFRPLVYNGWRHFYFAYAGIVVIEAYGIKTVWDRCANKKWSRGVCSAFLFLFLAGTAAGMMINHPRQAPYYNLLANDKMMETDYWNTCGTYALKRLINCKERNQNLELEVGCYFFDIQNARFKLDDEQKSLLTTTIKKDSPYLYYIDNYVQVYDIDPPEGYHVLFEVDSYGRKIGIMYERDEVTIIP